MQVNYAGFVPLSTVDWFGYSVATVFFRGCTLGCHDCQNKDITKGEDYRDVEEIKKMILESKLIISGVVFTGGEPLEQPEALLELIKWCKSQDLKTFIHTSGNQPKNLKDIIDLVDGVRLDVKPVYQFSGKTLYTDRWSRYCGRYVRSEEIVANSGKEYWLSTVALQHSKFEDIESIGVNTDNKRIIVVQGNERNPLTANELSDAYSGCYIYTRQEGLQWIPERKYQEC